MRSDKLSRNLLHTGKCLFTSSDDDRADVLVVIVLAQRIVKLLEEWAGQGIQGLWSVQGDFIELVILYAETCVGKLLLRPTPGFGVSVRMCS